MFTGSSHGVYRSNAAAQIPPAPQDIAPPARITPTAGPQRSATPSSTSSASTTRTDRIVLSGGTTELMLRQLQHAARQALPEEAEMATFKASLEAFKMRMLHELDAEASRNALPLLSWKTESAINVEDDYTGAHYLHLRDYEGKMADPPLGISSPYPASEDLDLHLQMLLQEQPSVLAILAGDAEVADRAQGYFRMNGVTDNVIVTSSLQESTRIGDYDVEIHQLMLQKKGDQKADGSHEGTGDVVTTPVVYVRNWKDGTHMPADSMEQLQDLLDRVKKPDMDGSRNRLPAAHCREGVGRAGQLLCARTIRKHGDLIRSSAHLIESYRQSRSLSVAYMPQQQAAIAECGKRYGIALNHSKSQAHLTSTLAHLGIVTGFEVPEYNLFELMHSLGSDVAACHSHWEHPEAVFDQVGDGPFPIMLEALVDDMKCVKIVWPTPDSNRGKNLETGEPVNCNARDFLQQQASAGAQIEEVVVHKFLPSAELGDLALFTALHPSFLQGMLLRTLLASAQACELDSLPAMHTLLQQHGVQSHLVDLPGQVLVEQRGWLAAALHQCGNFTIEYVDASLPDEPLKRFNFKGRDQDGALVGRQTDDDGGFTETRFADFSELADFILARCRINGEHAGFSILSQEPLHLPG